MYVYAKQISSNELLTLTGVAGASAKDADTIFEMRGYEKVKPNVWRLSRCQISDLSCFIHSRSVDYPIFAILLTRNEAKKLIFLKMAQYAKQGDTQIVDMLANNFEKIIEPVRCPEHVTQDKGACKRFFKHTLLPACGLTEYSIDMDIYASTSSYVIAEEDEGKVDLAKIVGIAYRVGSKDSYYGGF